MINDRHGYEAGDTLLKHIAGAALEALAPMPRLRLSSDEFAVALANRRTGPRTPSVMLAGQDRHEPPAKSQSAVS